MEGIHGRALHRATTYPNPITSYLWVCYSPMIRRHLSTYMGAQSRCLPCFYTLQRPVAQTHEHLWPITHAPGRTLRCTLPVGPICEPVWLLLVPSSVPLGRLVCEIMLFSVGLCVLHCAAGDRRASIYASLYVLLWSLPACRWMGQYVCLYD